MLATQNRITIGAPTRATRSTHPRVAYLDNLRIYLTLLVILHHAAIAYGGAGDWPVKEPATDGVSPLLLAIFNAVNQSYFMSLFFLLAGYFTPPALAAKGLKHFLGDRLIRLGIPLLIYSTLIVNINKYLLDVYYRGVAYQPFVGYNAGHLWFVQALLIMAGLYALYQAIAQHRSDQVHKLTQGGFPTDATLFACIGVLTLLTFAVRLRFPVGVWVLQMQLGHFVHYCFAFVAGIIAYHQDWLNQAPAAQARRWGWRALVAIPLFVVLVVLAGALDDGANVAKLLGGWHWQALAFALWESWLLVGISLWLLACFRIRLNAAGTLARMLAANVYTVYIIHQTVLIALNIALLSVSIPTIVKFLIAALLTILIGFGLSGLIRKLPLARWVIG
jgi:surface polysaccharide O-acyltransferase-like enzyme